MKTYYLLINTHSGEVTDWVGGPIRAIEAVHGDTVLFLCHFKYPDANGVLQNLDLSQATALRMVVKGARTDAGTLFGTQDTYNEGLNALENLENGIVSWLFPFTDSAIDTALGSAEDVISAWLEFSGVFQTYAQTLAQKRLDIVQELDSGNPGSPPPTTPSYYTAAQVDAAFVALSAFFAKTDISVDTVLAAGDVPDGIKRYRFTATGKTLTLPDPATLSAKTRFTAIIEFTDNLAAVTVNVAASKVIKSKSYPAGRNSETFAGQNKRIEIEHDETDYFILTNSTP